MNRISKIIKKKGFSEFRPTDEVLSKIGVNIKTWNKWVQNKKDPELNQLQSIADFLECQPSDLIETSPPEAHVTE